MYAVISTCGRQYKVAEGDRIRFEKLPGKVGDEVKFDEVLMIGKKGETRIGQPLVDGATVIGQILSHDRSKKIIVYKKKRRKGYEKRYGHRQPYTEVKIMKINVD